MKLSKLFGRGSGRSTSKPSPAPHRAADTPIVASSPTPGSKGGDESKSERGPHAPANARPPVPTTPLELDRADVQAAEALAADGRWTEAVEALTAANRAQRDPAIEIRLVELRRDAAAAIEPSAGRADWPPVYADPFPDVVGRLPEIPAAELTSEILGGAVAHHGCLIVRGVFSPEQVARTTEAIERTHLEYRSEIEARSAAGEDVDELPPFQPGVAVDLDKSADDAWYRPLPAESTMPLGALRKMVADQGGTWLGDSPSSTAQILDELENVGVIDAIQGHLGERPYFSLQKSTLRRSLPTYNLVAWHQDGSFLDDDVRTMNIWVALSPCGGDLPSPGMELMPRRIDEVLPVDGVMSAYSISYDLVDELAAEMPTYVPEFAPGDAMIFDERFLHRTHLTEDMTEIRYALECWFFAPSHQATSYTPLLV